MSLTQNQYVSLMELLQAIPRVCIGLTQTRYLFKLREQARLGLLAKMRECFGHDNCRLFPRASITDRSAFTFHFDLHNTSITVLEDDEQLNSQAIRLVVKQTC